MLSLELPNHAVERGQPARHETRAVAIPVERRDATRDQLSSGLRGRRVLPPPVPAHHAACAGRSRVRAPASALRLVERAARLGPEPRARIGRSVWRRLRSRRPTSPPHPPAPTSSLHSRRSPYFDSTPSPIPCSSRGRCSSLPHAQTYRALAPRFLGTTPMAWRTPKRSASSHDSTTLPSRSR